jgi:hypothetical protein
MRDLQCEEAVVDLDLLGEEIGADGGLVLIAEPLVDVPADKTNHAPERIKSREETGESSEGEVASSILLVHQRGLPDPVKRRREQKESETGNRWRGNRKRGR